MRSENHLVVIRSVIPSTYAMKSTLLATIATLVAGSAFPQTVSVTTIADSGPGSLRQAIADATPGGTIVFDPPLSFHRITLTSGELVITDDLTITGPGADRMAISGDSTSRVFRIEAGADVTITDITIRDGKAADGVAPSIPAGDGGGILSAGNLTLVQVVLSNNRSGDGAQSSVATASLHGGRGGAIYNGGGTLTLIRSTVSDNTSGSGGDCVSCTDGSPRGGFGGDGGALYSDNKGIRIVRSAIINNRTGDGGDCVNCSGDDPEGGRGGRGAGIGAGFGASSAEVVAIESSTLSGNQTGMGGSGAGQGIQGLGGGVYASEFALAVSHSTITNNDAHAGGGLYDNYGYVITVFNSIIARNTGTGGVADPEADCGTAAPGNVTSNGYNLFGEGTGCPATGTGDQTVLPKNVFANVIGPLQDNGGPTQTHALLDGSPAIDQGSCPGMTSDQRSFLRVVNTRRGDADDGCDTGAYEYSEFGGIPLDLIVHFKRPDGWGYPHVHYFETAPASASTTWPGEPMVHEGCGWYRYRFDGAVMAHMVFNGNVAPQTVDLFRSGEGWYDGTTDTWSETYPDPPCTDVVRLSVTALLQGPYRPSYGPGLMSTALWNSGQLPWTQPYSGPEITGPLRHNGDEWLAQISSGLPLTDWSIVELRSGSSARSKVAAKAVIHLRDGSLLLGPNLAPLEFQGVAPGAYHIVVRHRNHLPVMSADPVELSSTETIYDFTDSDTKAFGTNPMVLTANGKWAMWAADFNSSGVVDAADFLVWRDATAAETEGYALPDVNLDGTTNGLDFNLYIASTAAGAASQVLE